MTASTSTLDPLALQEIFMTADEIENTIERFLAGIKVEMYIEYYGINILDNWEHHSYSITFKSQLKNARKVEWISTPFRQGTGCGCISAPKVAAVLHSLLYDLIEPDTSFEDWAPEFGYDSDSRKAEAIYKACVEQTKLLNQFFTQTEILTFKKMLEDY